MRRPAWRVHVQTRMRAGAIAICTAPAPAVAARPHGREHWTALCMHVQRVG